MWQVGTDAARLCMPGSWLVSFTATYLDRRSTACVSPLASALVLTLISRLYCWRSQSHRR